MFMYFIYSIFSSNRYGPNGEVGDEDVPGSAVLRQLRGYTVIAHGTEIPDGCTRHRRRLVSLILPLD